MKKLPILHYSRLKYEHVDFKPFKHGYKKRKSVNYLDRFWQELLLKLFWRIVYLPILIWHLWNKPRTIHISKLKIIIGLYIVWTLLPISNKQHIIYADPITHIPPKIAPSPKPITMTTLSPVEAVSEVPVASVVSYTAPAVSGVTNCGSDPNLAYVYQHESGCRTDAIGPNGPCGLGQALPCSKLGCSLSDWDCQNNWFTNYAISVYGSTYNAMVFWSQNHWW